MASPPPTWHGVPQVSGNSDMSKRPNENRGPAAQQVSREEEVRAQMRLLDDVDLGVCLAAFNMLGSFGVSAKQAIPRLTESLFHEEDAVVLESVWDALMKIGADADSLVSKMVEDLKSSDQDLRIKAAELLARFGAYASREIRQRFLPSLLEFARKKTEDTRARCAIIRLLWESTWELNLTKKIALEMANLLDDGDEGVRKTAMRALEQFRPASMACAPKIIQCLRNRPGDVTWLYAEDFFRFVGGGDKHVDLVALALVQGLRAKDAKIRLMSASVLGGLREHAIPAVPALCEAMKDKNGHVRREAAESLGKLGECALRAVPALIEARHHADPTLQTEAEAALRKIAPDKYAAILLDESFVAPTHRQLPVKTVARYLGARRCQVGAEPEFMIDERESYVLQALVELRVADKAALIKKSGVKTAPRVLKRICEKYAQLATYIVLPGKRGSGGYRTTIKGA